MKKVGFNGVVVVAALAAGVGAFFTIPEGRGLNEQEKTAWRGLWECQKCTESQKCTYKSENVLNLVEGARCKMGTNAVNCQDVKGNEQAVTMRKTKVSLRTLTHCAADVWECKVEDPEANRLNYIWRKTYHPNPSQPIPKCGSYWAKCVDLADPNCIPAKQEGGL